MKQLETNVWKAAMLFLSPFGFRLSRNQRYKGPIVARGKITKAWADCGVFGDGGGDLIGYRIITILPDMVGRKIAQFVMLEAKYGNGKLSQEQADKIDMINKDGGLAAKIKNEDDMKKLID